MNKNFEKEFIQVVNKEQEIPSVVRQSIDHSFDHIRSLSKKKKRNFVWKRLVAAACGLIVTGLILSNEQVLASINELFNFGDKGVQRAVDEGFTIEDNRSATDQNIKITLNQHFSDANKVGLSFQILFEDATLLNKNVEKITFDYRLKNGDGEYISEHIPDTKPLKGNKSYVSGGDDKNPLINVGTGEVTYEVIQESNEGLIPKLEDALVEIESVNIFYLNGTEIELGSKVDGKWDLPLVNGDGETNSIIEFEQEEPSNIHVTSAKSSSTSLNLTFVVDGDFQRNENEFFDMKIVDEQGNEYNSEGFSMGTKNKQTTISTNFPITSYDNAEKLKLVIDGFGEAELVKLK